MDDLFDKTMVGLQELEEGTVRRELCFKCMGAECHEQTSRYRESDGEARGGDRKDVLYCRLRFYVFLAMTI